MKNIIVLLKLKRKLDVYSSVIMYTYNMRVLRVYI